MWVPKGLLKEGLRYVEVLSICCLKRLRRLSQFLLASSSAQMEMKFLSGYNVIMAVHPCVYYLTPNHSSESRTTNESKVTMLYYSKVPSGSVFIPN